MLAQGRPLIHQVILTIDKLTAHLGQAIDNENIYIAVYIVCIVGLAILNKYYGKTDKFIVYCLAIHMWFVYIHSSITNCVLVMHPRLKVEYFKQQNWEPQWIEEVRHIAREHYDLHYKQAIVPAKPSDKVRATVHFICATCFDTHTHTYSRSHRKMTSTLTLTWTRTREKAL